MWDRDTKKTILEAKENQLDIFLFRGFQYCKAKGYLNIRSCLQDAVINLPPSIRKNKQT